jgi:hypothetical protein
MMLNFSTTSCTFDLRRTLQRLDDAEFLDHLVHFRFAANAGGIDQRVILAVTLKGYSNAIPCRSGLVEDHEPILANQAIDQRRLANIWPANDGDT